MLRDTPLLLLLLTTVLAFSLASCSSPAEFTAGAAAIGTGAAAIMNAVAPLLSPEQLVQLQEGVANINGTVEATQAAVGAVVDAFTTFKTAVEANQAAMAAEVAERATGAEVALWSSGAGTAGAAASRFMSMLKHGVPARAAMNPGPPA